MSRLHATIILRQLKAFCFSFSETKVTGAWLESSGYLYHDYMVLLEGPLGSGSVRCRVINDLYCQARVIEGAA